MMVHQKIDEVKCFDALQFFKSGWNVFLDFCEMKWGTSWWLIELLCVVCICFFLYFYDLIQVVYYQSQCKSIKTGYLNPFNFCLCHWVFTRELWVFKLLLIFMFISLAYQGKDFVFRFIREYISLRDFGPRVI
jgi:hypothetical protein